MTNTTRFLTSILALLGLTVRATTAFVQPQHSRSCLYTETALSAGKGDQDEDLMRWARQSRSASSDDTVVELMRPLGLVLNQDDNGNVYVETVAPKGNAARTGKVRRGG